MPASESIPASAAFPVTHWSLVNAADNGRITVREEAMDTLCRLYWKPVYCFIRTQARAGEEASDLTQGFFAHLLEQGLVSRATPLRGRFRSFLLGCVKRYLSSERERTNTGRRGVDWDRLSLNTNEVEECLAIADAAKDRPDQAYDYACALSLINEALRLLEEECSANGRAALFSALKPYLQGDAAAPDHAETARKLGTSPGTISVTVHRLRQRYRAVLRSVVAQTLSDPLAVDEELRSLQEILEGR